MNTQIKTSEMNKKVNWIAKTVVLVVMVLICLLSIGTVSPALASQCSVEDGQAFIAAGQYKKAIQEFSCVIDAQPTEVEGYRGRIEAHLLLGKFSDAALDYARLTAVVLPVHPDAEDTILDGYAARLAIDPNSISALTGKSFAYWWFFEYNHAIQTLNPLLALEPDNVYATLFRGSSRVLSGAARAKGLADLERAITLAPDSPDVHFIVADAYTYGQPDPNRALAEATLALQGGLDTPRIRAILASAYLDLGDPLSAAAQMKIHIEQVTDELLTTSPVAVDTTLNLDLVAYRTYEIPVNVNAGENITIGTSSPDFWDTVLVLIAPDGTPVMESDDANWYFAELDWTAEVTGTYTLQVTSFEGVSTGELVVTRD